MYKLLKITLVISMILSNMPYINIINAQASNHINIESVDSTHNVEIIDDVIDTENLDNVEITDDVIDAEHVGNVDNVEIADDIMDTENLDNVEITDDVLDTENVVDVEITDLMDNTSTQEVFNNSTINTISVSDEQQLRDALTKSNSIINLQNNIDITGNTVLEINNNKSNITINGQGYTLNLNDLDVAGKDGFAIKNSSDITINDLKIVNYTKGITLYKSQAITLNNVILEGKLVATNKQSDYGLDINNSQNVMLNNIKTVNHKVSGIRLINGSQVELQGNMVQGNDAVDIVVGPINNSGTNTITGETLVKQYDSGILSNTNTNYTLKQMNVTTEFDLVAASKRSNTTIDFINPITVNQGIQFTGNSNVLNVHKNIELTDKLLVTGQKNIINIIDNININQQIELSGSENTLNGNNKSISGVGLNDHALVVKGTNNKVHDLIIKEYPKTGIVLYGAKQASLNNVTTIGTKSSNTVGIDVTKSIDAVLSNIQTLDNKVTGIKVQQGSSVTIFGNVNQKNDGVDLQVYTNGAVNTITGLDNYYVKVNSTATDYETYNLKTIEVRSEDELQAAVKKSGAVIELKENLTLTKKVEVTGTNVTINGNNYTLTWVDGVSGDTFVVKGTNDKQTIINNLTLSNYPQSGITLYQTKNVKLSNVATLGKTSASTVGIDVNGSTGIVLSDIKTSDNNNTGIRVQKGSEVTLEGVLSQQNDKVDLKDIVTTSQVNTITNLDKYYTKVSDTTDANNQTQTIGYNLTNITVKTESDLVAAVKKSGANITLTDDITITQNLEVLGKDIVIDGQGHTIDFGNKTINSTTNTNGFVVKNTSNVTIHNIKIANYNQTGLNIYQSKDVELKDVELIGTSGTSTVGIDINKSTDVVLENIKTSNHKTAGIRVLNESQLTVQGTMTHEDETNQLRIINEKDKTESTLTDPNNLYIEVSRTTNNTNHQTTITYKLQKVSHVKTFEELKAAVEIPYHKIILEQNITFKDNLEIKQKDIVLDGNNFSIDFSGDFGLTVKSENFELNNIKFKNYKGTALRVYYAKNAILNTVEFEGNALSVDKEERSKMGLDISQSTISLENITSSNHLYKGIQVRDNSTVDIISSMKHIDDNIHMQLIIPNNQTASVIKDANSIYTHGSTYQEEKNSTVDYYVASHKTVNSIKELIEAAAIPGTSITLNTNLKFENADLDLLGSDKQLTINKNVKFDGNNHTIDLNQLASILVKGQDIIVKNVTIENASSHGINVYSSRNILLENTIVKNSKDWGIFVNGSIVGLKNIQTLENTKGGIQITRSRTLRLESNFDSYVEVIGTINQKESNINVGITNLEMLDGTTSNNQFIERNNLYNRYDNDTKYAVLSDYYLELFEIKDEDRDKQYGQTEIDFMLIQQEIDVTNNHEVTDENGNYIQLKNDGITDNADNLEKFIAYAALNGRTLYFPEGTYVIGRDIDLSKLNLPALSNFTLKGSETGLSIFDGTSQQGKMRRISNAEYHSIMNYVNFDNLVFNNIGIEINGPHKKGVSFTNNAFINGKYTADYSANGSLYKVTLEPYIHLKNNKYVVENNVFLRGDNYPGRGVATYRTTNTTIKNNYFGILDGLAEANSMLPSEVITKATLIQNSGLVDNTPQGNFMTAINNERYDKNVLIENNYFNLDKTRNIIGDFSDTVLVSGINVATDGQRRDHIIYSKGYDGLNIVGNYFTGMENSAAGGVKIRNGNNAYIGSNYFNDVPLLTYIYGDLTKAETILYDTVIYNNIFQSTTNFGKEGTGILYYQSFRDGDTITYKSNGEVWTNAYGDVRNFVIYQNQFVGDERDQITISQRAKTALSQNQFIASGNVYTETGGRVNYHSGNASLSESTGANLLTKIPANSGYNTYSNMTIPLTPVRVDSTQLNNLVNNSNNFIQSLYDQGLIGPNNGQYSEESIQDLLSLIEQIQNQLKDSTIKQSTINGLFTALETSVNGLEPNDKGDETPNPGPEDDNNNGGTNNGTNGGTTNSVDTSDENISEKVDDTNIDGTNEQTDDSAVEKTEIESNNNNNNEDNSIVEQHEFSYINLLWILLWPFLLILLAIFAYRKYKQHKDKSEQ